MNSTLQHGIEYIIEISCKEDVIVTCYCVPLTHNMPGYMLGCLLFWPGACPTNGILIEFEIRPRYAVLWYKIVFTNDNEILHTLRQCNCRDVCKISL